MDVEKIIEQTVSATVLKLKMAGLLKDTNKSTFEKTEELLKNYNAFKVSEQPYTQKLVKKIDDALDDIKMDPYYDLISMFYFDGLSRFQCSQHFNTTETTISRNKTRLVNKLKSYLFSDEVIEELFL